MVALIAVLKNPASTTKLKTSLLELGNSKILVNFVSKKAATTASKVLPVAIPRVVIMGAPVVKFTKAAAKNITGQNLIPKSIKAAREMPVGAQTRVAKPLWGSSNKPIFAVIK